MAICPFYRGDSLGDCDTAWLCSEDPGCRLRPQTHFVGFTDPQRYAMAVLVFGDPDFVHRIWDHRAKAEIMVGDVAVFAKYRPDMAPSRYSWDDSNQPNDPAAKERT